jgi:hypothetical protein
MEGVNLRCIVSTFINVIMYPGYNYNMLMRERGRERERDRERQRQREIGQSWRATALPKAAAL